MTQYDNTNRGVLFKNDRREKDTHPEYNGTINIEGQEYWLNAWIKDGGKGKFFSLSVKPKEARQDAPPARGGAPSRNAPRPTQRPTPATKPADSWEDDFDSDPIPFLTNRSHF